MQYSAQTAYTVYNIHVYISTIYIQTQFSQYKVRLNVYTIHKIVCIYLSIGEVKVTSLSAQVLGSCNTKFIAVVLNASMYHMYEYLQHYVQVTEYTW